MGGGRRWRGCSGGLCSHGRVEKGCDRPVWEVSFKSFAFCVWVLLDS